MKRFHKKGGVLDNLGALVSTIVVVGIILVVGFIIMAQGKAQIVDIQGIDEDNASTYTTAYNATGAVETAMDDIPGWLPLVIIAGIGGILLGLVTLLRR